MGAGAHGEVLEGAGSEVRGRRVLHPQAGSGMLLVVEVAVLVAVLFGGGGRCCWLFDILLTVLARVLLKVLILVAVLCWCVRDVVAVVVDVVASSSAVHRVLRFEANEILTRGPGQTTKPGRCSRSFAGARVHVSRVRGCFPLAP